jgi:hypothetical protein
MPSFRRLRGFVVLISLVAVLVSTLPKFVRSLGDKAVE